MVATASAIAGLIGAGASAGSGIMGMFANNNQQQRAAQIQQEQLDLDRQNATNQGLVQALVNQRAVAGQQDSFGSSLQYDPATNTWKSVLGPLPEAAQRSALGATTQQNTTDRARQELLNSVAMQRAMAAGPAADAAMRDVGTFRPMQGNELTGLLTDQATTAARQAYDPLRADVLRSTARTGTAAGPVMAELGRSEAANLRQSLIDAQIQGMTGVGQINAQRFGNLAQRAATTQGLATPNAPQLSTTPISDPGSSALSNQLAAAMARGSASGTSGGMAGANNAGLISNQAATGAAGSMPNSNFDLQQAALGLKTLGQSTQPGGDTTKIINSLGGLFGNNQRFGNHTNWFNSATVGDGTGGF